MRSHAQPPGGGIGPRARPPPAATARGCSGSRLMTAAAPSAHMPELRRWRGRGGVPAPMRLCAGAARWHWHPAPAQPCCCGGTPAVQRRRTRAHATMLRRRGSAPAPTHLRVGEARKARPCAGTVRRRLLLACL
jgi:hypothetical protein